MARSIVNQGLLLQTESAVGDAATGDMQRFYGIKGTVGWEIEQDVFRAAGSKAATGKTINSEMGTADLEVQQDYNAMLPLLTGVFGAPSTTEESGTSGETAYVHEFEIDPFSADDLVSYTGMWGEPDRALQVTAMVFHGLTIGIQRTNLSLSSNAILRAPKTGESWPDSEDITDIPFTPIRAQSYCVYLDSKKEDLGDTKLEALYDTEISFGDKYTPDWVVDCSLDSYKSLMEQTDIDYTQSLVVGFDSDAEGMIDDAMNGDLKFVRIEAEGPEINDEANYKIQVDTCVSLTPSNVGESPVSPATVVNFDGTLMVDPETQFLTKVTLTNTVDFAS